MTYAEVYQAKVALDTIGQPVSAQTIQQYVGRGDTRAISRALNQIARRESARTLDKATPQRPTAGSRPLDLRSETPDRETEAAQLDSFIAARRAEGHGQASPPPRPVPAEEDEEPLTKEARARQRTRRLVASLLHEVVPWLTR